MTAQTPTAIPSTNQNNRANASDQSQPEHPITRRLSRQNTRLARRDGFSFTSPFGLFQRLLSDDLADWFERFDDRHQWIERRSMTTSDKLAWAPQVDVTQRGDHVVIRADLPGIKPDDLVVEVNDDAITISGERRDEHVDENSSIYRVERTFGTYFRQIPLPSGARSDQATATFKNGVLEITVPAPADRASHGRRLDVASSDTTSKDSGTTKAQ
jgi:HSP20 family protein